MRKLFLILMSLLVCSLASYAQTSVYHGTVLDAENDEPLVGVTVMPIGGGQITVTDIDGKFTLTVPATTKEVKVSYVGMETVTVPLADNMVIKMKTASTSLKDLVVIGYGSARKLGSVVGSVSIVGEKALENSPTATFIDALQGEVPGLNIFSNSGDPSSTNNSVRIRGVSSLNAGTTPLYILDGAPISAAVFTTLNSDDIQNITVLKDAASVAIYGSRAANGVIVITSKKGSYGMKPSLTVRANYGWSQMVEDNVKMMNSEQYIEFRDKIGSPVSDEVRKVVNDFGISTNWRDVVFDSSAPTYSLNASLSGGGDLMSYYLSLDHYDAEGIITQSGMRRETLRVNLNSKLNDWFRINLQSNLGYTKYETNPEASASEIYTSNPMVFARIAYPYDSPYYYTIGDNGRPVFGDKSMKLHYSQLSSPDFNTRMRDTHRTNVTANINLSEQITPIQGLIIKAQQAVDAYDYRLTNRNLPYESYRTPMGDLVGDMPEGETNTGSSQQRFERYYSWTYTNTAEYSFNLKDLHNFILLAGEESILTRSNAFGAYSTGHNDQRMMLLNQGTTVTIGNLSESMNTTTFNSLFFKADYDYDSRYFLSASYRRDGSSKFAPGHRWSNFFSVGAMWNAKNEKFLGNVTWLNEAQARVSYGTTGNSSIPDYMFFGSVDGYVGGYGPNGSMTSATTIAQASNHLLTWETVRSFDTGLRVRAFNRFTTDVDFYHKTTKDMLMNIPWSFTTGFGSGWGNIGSMNNTGVDFNITADIISGNDWYWSARANFNYNHNRITELFNGRDSFTVAGTGLRYEVGGTAGEFYTVRYVGVDPADGKQVWLDKNDNPTKIYNEEENSVMTGKSQYAPWTGGFGSTVAWKGLALQVDFNWAAKKYMTNNDAFFLQNAAQGNSQNQTVEMLNVWTKPGDVTIYPNATETIQFDSRLLEDASFLRLKALTLSYDLPKNLLKKIYLNKVMLHFTGRNLWTLTKFKGYDPEPQANVFKFAYPNTRQYEFGIEVSI